jgi:radical SAM protein with 4Fe4S-binding SPASM domain
LLTPTGCGLAIKDDQALGAAEAEEILRWFAERSGDSEVRLEAACAPHYVRIQRQHRDDGTPEHGANRAPVRKNRADGPGCQAGRASCFISHRGEVFACGNLPIPAGNLFERSFREIWDTAPILKDLRDAARIHGKCGICEFHDVCTGCRARAYALTGDYLDEEPRCIYKPGRSYAESQERGVG